MDEIETCCEYCKKKFYNVYSLKRHYEKCKFKGETENKNLSEQNKKLQKNILQLEKKNKDLYIDNELSKAKIEFLNQTIEIKEKEIKYLKERIEKLIDKLSISSVSNIVNVYSSEPLQPYVVNTISDNSTRVITDNSGSNKLIEEKKGDNLMFRECVTSTNKINIRLEELN